ncbi:MAG: cell wall-binding repeat-containing protein [Thermoleophilaceae bacterium]
MPRRSLLLAAAAALALSGCSLKSNDSGGGGAIGKGVKSDTKQAAQELGFPVAATRDTTRVSGDDAVANAAGVAEALFPASTPATRPASVALVDKNDWQAGIAAAVLAGEPLHAPLLLSDGGSLPAATSGTLGRLKPKGQALSKGAQVILVGDGPPAPGGFKSGRVHGKDPFSIAAAVDSFQTAVAGKPSARVIVASADQPAYAMPAAAWSARSGEPVLFVSRNVVPAATRKAIGLHAKPEILLMGPPGIVSPNVEAELKKLGTVTRIPSKVPGPVAAAAEFARSDKTWGAHDPGRIYSLANIARPSDAAAAAALGSNGVYAPLLLTDKANVMPPALESYLLDVQPGFENDDPSQAVYNRVWLLGNTDAISQAVQARIDQLTQLVPVDKPPKQ